jgi:hypothetical protein
MLLDKGPRGGDPFLVEAAVLGPQVRPVDRGRPVERRQDARLDQTFRERRRLALGGQSVVDADQALVEEQVQFGEIGVCVDRRAPGGLFGFGEGGGRYHERRLEGAPARFGPHEVVQVHPEVVLEAELRLRFRRAQRTGGQGDQGGDGQNDRDEIGAHGFSSTASPGSRTSPPASASLTSRRRR